MKNETLIVPGQVLHNGAVAVGYKGGKVLAVNKGSVQPYVIWEVMLNKGELEFYNGSYFSDLSSSVIVFNTSV